MTDFREILVLGLGRSGSNLLSSLLQKVEGNAGFYEIFFETKAQGLQGYPSILKRVGEAIGAVAVEGDEPAFLAARDVDPIGYFDALSQSARAEGFRSLTCKIFARQITEQTLETLLRRPGVSVIFLTRNRIDRYISDLKGLITGQYVKADTTAVRPRLELAKFLSNVFSQDRDLELMYEAVIRSGVPYGHLDYGRDLDVSDEARA